jgi:organic radical activating enzyme
MYRIPNKVDFYITNVCNLTCDRCNRFNNHNFRGWQRWSDYESVYEQWGKLVNLKAVTIMGGEPFLNPTLGDWIQGINRIFKISVQVLTNGTRFRQSLDLYNTLLPFWEDGAQNSVGVSLHNANELPRLRNDINYFLKGTVTEHSKNSPGNIWNSDIMFEDSNGVKINVYLVDYFGSSAIQTSAQIGGDMQKLFYLHDSDPVKAHNICTFAKFKSYHFVRGRLFKCGPVALLPEFVQQHSFDLSQEDLTLLNSYQSLGTDNFDQYHQEFFKNLDNPIPQCKFCPSESIRKFIAPIRKGNTTSDIF